MRLLFTLLFLFTVTFSFGQTTFTTAIAGLDHFELYGLVQMSDGSYIATGATYSKADSSAAIGMVKLSSDGHLLMSKTFTPGLANEDVEGASIIKTSDGGVAVSGTISDTMVLMKFDANLNLQWHKQYITSANYSYGNKAVQTSDGGYLIVGHLENDTDTSYSAAGYAVKTDAQGNVTWSKQFYNFKDANILDAVAVKDGTYALLASSADYPSNNDTTYLIKITGNGDVVWSKYISASLDGQSPTALVATTDGGFAVCGAIDRLYTFNGFDYRDAQVMLLRFDQNGNLGWAKVSDNGLYNDINIRGIVQDQNGGFIITGEFNSYDPITSSTRAYALRVNSGGNVQWTKAISFLGASEYFNNITAANDGTLAMAGTIYAFDDLNGDYNRGCIFKFNSAFNTCGDVNNFGALSDLTATATSATPSILNLTTTAEDNIVIETSAGSEISICSVLPVQLLSFGAALQSNTVHVDWQTTNETNADYYVVERSNNPTSFTDLQKITAKGNGSGSVQAYSVIDQQPLAGTSYYRLQQVDKNGTSTYSNTVSVTVTASGTIVISPNPVYGNTVRVVMHSTSSSKVTFCVTDLTGKTLASQTTQVSAGSNTISIPAASLSKGVYILKVTQNNTAQSIKFIKE